MMQLYSITRTTFITTFFFIHTTTYLSQNTLINLIFSQRLFTNFLLCCLFSTSRLTPLFFNRNNDLMHTWITSKVSSAIWINLPSWIASKNSLDSSIKSLLISSQVSFSLFYLVIGFLPSCINLITIILTSHRFNYLT